MGPVEIVFSYWEYSPSQARMALESLRLDGIEKIICPVPWSLFESDISHTLQKFLTLTREVGMHVSLVVTPEMGIHYKNSGLPKDLLVDQENLARTQEGSFFSGGLFPNYFSLPSLFSENFTKRYEGYLTRMSSFLSDLEKLAYKRKNELTILISGSFWKYYRDHHRAVAENFSDTFGDDSKNSRLVYHRFLEQFYSQDEFCEPTPAASEKWKRRTYDSFNHKFFYSKSEELFRHRTKHILSKTSHHFSIEDIEMFVPEFDPALLNNSFLSHLFQSPMDIHQLSSYLDAIASRTSFSNAETVAPSVYWTGWAGFQSLSDPEKQFLILKSLFLIGSRNGKVFIDYSLWKSVSHSFKKRLNNLSEFLINGKFKLQTKALYLTPHLWSQAGALWQAIQKRLRLESRVSSSFDAFCGNYNFSLAFIDPHYLIMDKELQKILDWVSQGRVVCFPRNGLFTEKALRTLDSVLRQKPQLELNFGLPHKIYHFKKGNIVFYEAPNSKLPQQELTEMWEKFVATIFDWLDIHYPCHLSDDRLQEVPLTKENEDQNKKAIFILNTSSRKVNADILFRHSVKVMDLGSLIHSRDDTSFNEGDRFSLEAPSFGILPLGIEMDEKDLSKKRITDWILEMEKELSDGTGI